MAKCNQLTPLPFKGLNSLPVNLDSLSSINFVHKLEKLAIKNGMSLQATQCDVTSNLNFLGASGQQRQYRPDSLSTTTLS